MNKLLITYILLTIHQLSISQLITNSSVSPANLVQNTLLGQGVNAYNISYTGSNNAIGFFDGSNCNINLSNGIIMTTGTVNNQTSMFGAQQGPFGPNDRPNAGVDNNEAGDSQLANYSGGNTTTNAAILEFDFDATGNTVSFNYVFGSDEYPEYVNAGYNDVFAFWISGPGISGSQNIAVIPNTTTPVTIDNVNAGSNSGYFINNGDGNSGPQNSDATVVQYDGFTTVLTATADVQCGETYHIRIAICDVGDGAYDSGVFLEGGSFTSQAPMLVNSQINTQGNLGENQLLEGCSNATINFVRSDSINFTKTYNVTYSGSATNGTDYSNLPNTVTFSAGESTTSINVQTIADNITEGTEDLTITLEYSGMCGQQTSLTTTLQIVEQTPISITMPNNQELSCITGNSITLSPVISGGTPPYNYNWSTGENTSEITVEPTDTTTYLLTVTDACGSQIVNDSVTLTVAVFEPLIVTASNDTTVFCPNSPIDVSSFTTGGAGNISFNWSNGSNTQNATFQTIVSKTYIITATDQCGNQSEDSVHINIISTPLKTNTYGDTTICPFGNAVIGVNATEGAGGYRYEWDNNETTNQITVSPGNTRYFYVKVYDSCNTYFIRDSVLVTTKKPIANFHPNPLAGIENIPIYFGNHSQNAINYTWDFGNGEGSIEVNPTTVYNQESTYDVTLIATDLLGCKDTIIKPFVVHPEYFGYIPNAFSPNDDGVNDGFKGSFLGIKELEMYIFNRWGDIIYTSYDTRATWNGTENGQKVPSGVYVYKISVKDYSNRTHDYTGHVVLIR